MKNIISNPRFKKGLFLFLLFGTIALAFLLRYLRAEAGLPYIHNWDEPQTASTALQMLRTGDLNPHFFNYGSLLIYINYFVDIAHYLYLMGNPEGAESFLNDLSQIVINKDTGWHWTISHPSFYYWNRLVTVFFGTGTVVFTYLLAKIILYNRYFALLAALFLAVLDYHIYHSVLITTDAPVAFFVIGAVYFSVRYLTDDRIRFIVFSLIFCGFAAATKYNSALTVLLPTLVLLYKAYIKKKDFNYKLLLLIPTVPLVTFFISMPYAFLDVVTFLKHIGYEVRHYKVYGHGVATSIPGLEHIKFQIKQFLNNLGLFSSFLIIIGGFLVFKNRKLWLVAIIPTLYFFYMTGQKVNFHRNFLQIYPFLAIFFAAGFMLVCSSVLWLVNRYKNSYILYVTPVLSAVIIFIMIFLAYPSMAKSLTAYNTKESRSEMVDKINKLDVKGKVIIAKELRMHSQDLCRLTNAYQVVPATEFLGRKVYGKDNIGVIPANATSRTETKQLKETINIFKQIVKSISEEDTLLRTGGSRGHNIDILSANPGVIAYKLSTNFLKCLAPKWGFAIENLSFSRELPINKEKEIGMLWNSNITTPGYRLEKDVNLALTNRSTSVDRIYAKVEIELLDLENGEVVLRKDFFSQEKTKNKIINFSIKRAGVYAFRISFVNDAVNKEKKEDRNLYISSVVINPV